MVHRNYKTKRKTMRGGKIKTGGTLIGRLTGRYMREGFTYTKFLQLKKENEDLKKENETLRNTLRNKQTLNLSQYFDFPSKKKTIDNDDGITPTRGKSQEPPPKTVKDIMEEDENEEEEDYEDKFHEKLLKGTPQANPSHKIGRWNSLKNWLNKPSAGGGKKRKTRRRKKTYNKKTLKSKRRKSKSRRKL
jgi:hypothetical protein